MSRGSIPGGDDPSDDRRYGDEDLARILRRAVELQEAAPRRLGKGAGSGLSLAEIRQVAAEAGIDPRWVDQAAGEVDRGPEEEPHPFVGAPTSWEFRHAVPGEVPQAEMGRMLDEIRRIMRKKGEVQITASAGVSFLAARALWAHVSARWDRKLRATADRLAAVAASLTRGAVGRPDEEGER